MSAALKKSSKRNYKDTKHGLVLTGGGARAAYQVGVLKAITSFVPRNHGIPFPVICGTSAGAINSTALACYSSCFHLGVKKLEWIWKNLKPNKIYHADPVRAFGHLFGGVLASFQADYAPKVARSLINNAPLRDLLNQVIDFKRIDTNIINQYLSAVAVTASSYSSGDSISFYQSEEKITPWFRHKRRGQPAQINVEHLMASAALPMLFPSIRIKSEHYGDGSINQLSPLSPAVHLGAEKLFIVGVEQPKEPLHVNENNPHPPSTATIAGHLLDTVFSETLQSDLERVERLNQLLQQVPQEKQDATGIKQIDTFVINPSHDFNAIAAEYYYDLPLTMRLLLRTVGVTNDSDSSLISYLLFEQHYCSRLIKLGYEDALNKESEIKTFLSL
ncbi:patatin-like phospholipase family protein [Thalassotalea agarivorans]|uniref:NTE family protein n=1 Tax=Thalassotalea agarivorans TaxID=349064 RepID=A0A1I0GRS7_THASX|nr:patatin-like phospholipase family protein [Thalassotalea agarivorans]SET74075.1 NTE family protein [Thalassotalea agarivorans]